MPHQPLVLNIGVGRSGTTFCANALRQIYGDDVLIEHEPLTARQARMRAFFRCYEEPRRKSALKSPHVAALMTRVERQMRSRPVVIAGHTLAHLAPALADRFPDQLRVIHLHRHPIPVTASGFVNDLDIQYERIPELAADPDSWKFTPFDPHVQFPSVGAVWPRLGRFGRIVYQWLEHCAAGEEFPQRVPQVPFASLQADEHVFRSDRFIDVFADFIGRSPARRLDRSRLRQNPTWTRMREENPLGNAWREYRRMPELVRFAEALGYVFDDEQVATDMRKYQLPATAGARVRHAVRYWQFRRWSAGLLRRWRLLPQQNPVLGGGPPRPTIDAVREAVASGRDTTLQR
jgi:hypothetical protein